MKKTVLSVALIATSVIASTFSVKAQKGFMLGAEGTPQMSWILNEDDRSSSSISSAGETYGVSFGISGQYGFTENLGIGLNALYSFQGQRYNINGEPRFKRVDYVKVPVMFVYTWDIGTNWMFTGKIGPQVSFLASASLRDNSDNFASNNGVAIVSDHQAAYAKVELGGALYAGFGYKITDNLCVDASVRYDYGFTDAEDKDYKQDINNPRGTSNGFAVNPDRVMSNNTTVGLTIGVRYLFSAAGPNQ